MEQNIDLKRRMMMTLWFAMFMAVVMYFIFSRLVGIQFRSPTQSESLIIVTITIAAMVLIVTSFALKRMFLKRSVEAQSLAQVQSAYLIAWAFCEASALFGLLEAFAFGYRLYYILFILAAIGILAHFPTREHLLAASYKNSNKL
jgi:F0F1-type ATP synthase membrane subunit c/vacuolar-type H+-ATPase subunit K